MGSVVGKKKKKSSPQSSEQSQPSVPDQPASEIEPPCDSVDKCEEVDEVRNVDDEEVEEDEEDDEEEVEEDEEEKEEKEEEKEEEEEEEKEEEEQPEDEGYEDNSVNQDWNDINESDNSDDEEEKENIAPNEFVEHMLNGDINLELPPLVRIVRIFTSSTFTDTFHERNSLMVNVYPKLKEYCQSQGYDFQVVDMRWGVRDEATADHMTSELCMRELKACQKLSTGPNFITLLGQKYGYRPFPPKIPANELDSMLEVISNEADIELIKKWFYLDSNTIPSTYVLQPINDLLPNYNNQTASKDGRSQASSDWWAAFERMQAVFRQAATKALKGDKNSMWKYFMSVTEDEINRGILKAKEPLKHCYWFKRNINDIHDHISEHNTRNFIDKIGPDLDTQANDLLESLKSEKIPKVLTPDKISVYDVNWHPEVGIDPMQKQHDAYLKLLCKDFQQILVNMIDDGIKEREAFDIDDKLIKEICQQAATCQEKSRVFHGREEVLQTIESYLSSTSENNKPLIVYGPSGCGKTSIMAKAGLLAKQNHADRIQITRFLGTTSDSSTLAKLLHSICCQLKRATGESAAFVPANSKKLIEYLANLIEELKESETEVIMFLDSIDQLSPDDGAYLMKWLPKELPSCMKIVISTLPDEKYQILFNLKHFLPETSFLEVPKLPVTTANDILSAWLSDASKKLTEAQTKIVMDAFLKCPLPLFLKLCFDKAVNWKSYTKPEETALDSNIKDAINSLFARLERLHGKALVSHALGLITTSKHGLTDAEIDEILSIDDDVLNDVYQYWTPPVRRIPPLLWVRVKSDLGSYIVSRGANGSLVNMWYHRQFTETATERYLHPKLSYHVLLSEYFRGVWSNGKKKSFTGKNGDTGESDRLVAAQPNSFQVNQDGSEGVYNYRKLSELPRHLIVSKNIKSLKDEVLFNFDFLWKKLKAFGYQYVLEDCAEATQQFPDDREIKLIEEFFKISGKTLMADPNQLAGQLVGRASNTSSEHFFSLLKQAKMSNSPCLYPSERCYDELGGPIIHSLAGHEQAVNYAVVTADKKRLISASGDSTVRIWDLSSGRQLRCIDCEDTVSMIFPFQNDTCAIFTSYSKLISQNLQTEEIYYNEYHSSSYGESAVMTKDGEHFVMLNEEGVAVFDCKDKVIALKHKIEDKPPESKDPLVDIIMAGTDQFVYSRKVKDRFFVGKIADHKYKKKIKSPSSIVFFTFSEDRSKFVLLNSPSSVNEAYKTVWLHIYDPVTWNIVKKLEGMDSHTILYVTNVSMSGDELIWPTMLQINFWNVQTGRERHAMKSGYQGNQYKQAISGQQDTLIVVSMDQNNTAMLVYDTNLIEFNEITAENVNKTDIEKAKDYVGKGEREMFVHPTELNMAVSIPPMDPIFTFYDTTTYNKTRKVTTQGLFSTFLYLVDDRHVLIWEHNKKSVITIDFIEGRVVGATTLPLGDYPPSLYNNTWVLLRQTNELLMFDKSRKKFQIFDWKTGVFKEDLKTGWKNQAQHILASKDGNIILCGENNNDHTKSVPLMIFDTVQRKKVGEIRQEGRMDLRPEVAVLSEDGKYFICVSADMYGVNVYKVPDGTLLTKLEYKIGDDMCGSCTSLTISVKMACVIVNYMAPLPVPGSSNYENQNLLVAYGLETWEKLAETRASGMVSRFNLSADGTRMMTDVRGGGNDRKTITLYDLSKLHSDRVITTVASLLPETDTRFCYVTQDGQSVGVGLAGMDGVVFFRPCGLPEAVSSTSEYTEVVIEYDHEKKK